MHKNAKSGCLIFPLTYCLYWIYRRIGDWIPKRSK